MSSTEGAGFRIELEQTVTVAQQKGNLSRPLKGTFYYCSLREMTMSYTVFDTIIYLSIQISDTLLDILQTLDVDLTPIFISLPNIQHPIQQNKKLIKQRG